MLISDSDGRQDGGSGFTRLFGNAAMGAVFSMVHAAVIRSGNELEAILQQQTDPQVLRSLASTIEHIAAGEHLLLPGKTVAFKGKGICRSLGFEGHSDVVVFDHLARQARVIELKDGDNFDTKKSEGEREGLIRFSQWLAIRTNYAVDWALCSFNQNDRTAIVRGLKGRFDAAHVLTGQELCHLIGVSYVWVIGARQEGQRENLAYVIRKLIEPLDLRALFVKQMEYGFPVDQESLEGEWDQDEEAA